MENIYNSAFIDGLPNKNCDFPWQTVKLPEGSSLQKTWQSTVGHILVTDHIKSRNKTLDHPMNMWVCLEIALFKNVFPMSMDWFKGKSTGNHGISHQI